MCVDDCACVPAPEAATIATPTIAAVTIAAATNAADTTSENPRDQRLFRFICPSPSSPRGSAHGPATLRLTVRPERPAAGMAATTVPY